MKNLRVKNLEYNGRKVSNQFLIEYEESGDKYQIFQSYGSVLFKFKYWEIIEVGKDWNFSRTTAKYRNRVTRLSKKEIEKMLEKDFEWNDFTQSYLRK